MVKKSDLSMAGQRLVAIMQANPYSSIYELPVANGDPVFDPSPRLVRDIKLAASDNCARPELQSGDFLLKREHLELFETLKRLGEGRIDEIQVKGGLPFRVFVTQRI